MRVKPIAIAGFLALWAASAPAARHDNDIHAQKLACTKCHVKTPGPSDTIQTAPLIMPQQELCKGCHKISN